MKSISISKFKTHLSAELKDLANHGELVVLDHSRPVARVIPSHEKEPVSFRPATVAWTVRELPPLVATGSTQNALMEDRNKR